MIILEQCTVRVEPSSNHVPYGFSIGKYYYPCSFCTSLHSFFLGVIAATVHRRHVRRRRHLHACTPATFSRSVRGQKAQKEKCYSFRRRLVSTVRREHGRGAGQLVAGAAAGQLRVHAESVVIVATAHRGLQRAQARH